MQQLADLEALSKGATFKACDFHVHSPASADMDPKWENASPGDLVEKAIAAGLDVIGITDHNTVAWCDGTVAAAAGTSLTVLPGVELSTTEGHLIALFDQDKPASELREFLIQIGIREKDFGNLDVIAKGSITDLAALIDTEGGIAVAAHVDSEGGFMKMAKTGARRKEIRASPHLRIYEIANETSRAKFLTGDVHGNGTACFQGSDSWPTGGDRHQLDAVGNRKCYLKMEQASVWALREASCDPGLRVRLVSDRRPTPVQSIEGIWVTGGFLSGQTFRFSDEITCLIGDTGSGKSLTIELIRFALDQQVDPVLAHIREEVDKLLAFALAEKDTVHVLIRKGEERYLVERSWMLSSPPPPLVYRVEDGQIQDLEDAIEIPTFFQIKGYSQGEIIEYAREPIARLSLIDALIDISDETQIISRAKSDLKRNASDIVLLEKERTDAAVRLKDLGGTSEEIKRLSEFLKHPDVRQQEIWHKEANLFTRVRKGVKDLLARPQTAFAEPTELIAEGDVPDKLANPDLVKRLTSLASDVRNILATAKTSYESDVDALGASLNEIEDEWKTRSAEAERRYKEVLASLGEEARGEAAVLAKLKKLRSTESGLRSLKETIAKDVIPKLKTLEAQRDELLSGLQTARKDVTTKRRKKADQLVGHLDDRVGIDVRHAKDRRQFKDRLMSLKTGSRLQESDVEKLAESLHPISLVKGLLSGELEGLAEEAEVQTDVLARLRDAVEDKLSELYDLQTTDLPDVVKVKFEVGPGTYKDLEALAHGQKCTVVLMISLAEGDFALLVDQPEDALHAPWIENHIVTTLRSKRGTRQCVFATRSANVLVSSDAEQIVALKADAFRGEIEKTGSIDGFDTRDLVLFHVEGGKDAFVRRQDKYGLRSAE